MKVEKLTKFLLLLFVLVFGIGSAAAQDLDNKGKEFVMTFLPNLSSPNIELHLTGSEATDVVIHYPMKSPTFVTTVAVVPGTVTIVSIPASSSMEWTLGSVMDNAVHAYAEKEFVCYMINRYPYTSDAALALPTDVMNTEYIVLTYSSSSAHSGDRSQFAIAAAYDNTTVSITPKVAMQGGYAAGTKFDILLNRGDAFLGQATGFGVTADLSGTIISSDKPIGLTNGNLCTNIPPSVYACDHVFEVAQSVQTWGNQVLVANLPKRTGGTVYRVIASEDNTTLSLDGAVAATLNRGSFYESALIPGNHIFAADKPIFVAQFMPGQDNPGAEAGDPAMGNMIPSQQYQNAYTFSTVGGNQFEFNYVSIIAANSDVGTLQLDGNPIPAGDFSPIAGSSFSAVTKAINSGTHYTASVHGHGISIVGLNNYDSYIYPGGARFQFINPVGDANAPICEVKFEGSLFYGTVYDNRPSEDTNGNDVLDPGEDLNNNGLIDEDTGIFFVVLDPSSVNLTLQVDSFVPGEGQATYYAGKTDPNLPAYGSVVVTDGAGNFCSSLIDYGGGETEGKSFIAVLLGKKEIPAVITDGSGGGMFVLNERQDTLHYWIRICELKCPLTAAHFHTGSEEVEGPVVKDITSEMIIYPGELDAYVHGVWTATDAEPLTADIVSELLKGNVYVNVHTTGYPDGEIRGQITYDVPAYLYTNLDGSQEVPPVVTTGSGEGHFMLSGDGTKLNYHVKVNNLSGTINASHFHKAGIGKTGAPVKDIEFEADTSAGTWEDDDAQPLTPELVADLLGCFIYVNVHTSSNPDGEIRGQLFKTEEIPFGYMTLLAAKNNPNPDNFSKLSFYSLVEGKPFENDEGDITGYDGQKNIVDMTIDIGGNVYLLNNSWTSMLYRIRPEQFDFNPSTNLRAKQMGRLRTSPDDTYIWLTNIQFIKGKLYGFNSLNSKLYETNPFNAHVTEIATLNVSSSVTGFVLGADGNVYLFRQVDSKNGELWRFDNFPLPGLTLVTSINSPDKLKSFTSHPNGNLYATDSKNIYEINLSSKTIGVLKDHPVDIAAMGFDYYTELFADPTGKLSFTILPNITDVTEFTGIPKEYSLAQNYPNPFNPVTTIKYTLPEATFVKLVVYNSLGEVVKTLVNDNRGAGYYETVFDAKDLSSGMYIYRLEAGQFVSTAKMILIK